MFLKCNIEVLLNSCQPEVKAYRALDSTAVTAHITWGKHNLVVLFCNNSKE